MKIKFNKKQILQGILGTLLLLIIILSFYLIEVV
jgi:hypothetical protein